ncbi:hypothetical protein O3P69_014257 [Scylla paramamosain]|uniref:Ionotropic glutamate receptor C-terminal domain-containing protein n=1 Tax=Scylla paramamosain TaxID=85552 RepID=A0AAW0TB02_SCYPA
MFLNQQQDSSGNWFSAYSHLPYSPRGPQVVSAATWKHNALVQNASHFTTFPEKFSDFHGATINVAALPYAPYWDETVQEAEDGRPVKIYSGTDYQLLSVMCHYLNFKIYNIPTSSWQEIGQLVAERKAFMSPVHHVPVAQRLAMYDFSYGYEFGSIDFCAAVPSLSPKWHSLYYPLSDYVWLAVLAVLVIVPFSLFLANLLATWLISENRMSLGVSSHTVIATLLAQDLPVKPPNTHAIRALVAAWLLFAFIVGTVYRGNLTASLTLPKYPPRPETIADLVKTFDREAHVGWRSYVATIIASHFILADGSTEIYLGRESVSHTLTAWPLPHDAPFKRQVDTIMVAVLEGPLLLVLLGLVSASVVFTVELSVSCKPCPFSRHQAAMRARSKA